MDIHIFCFSDLKEIRTAEVTPQYDMFNIQVHDKLSFCTCVPLNKQRVLSVLQNSIQKN